MHRQVGSSLFQGQFELFHKQPLAPHFTEGSVQNLVALGRHAQQPDHMTALGQQGLNMMRLPEGQTAFTGGNGERGGAHGVLFLKVGTASC